MADGTLERETLRFKAHDNGDATFSIATHDISGGTGVADSSLEFEGVRLLAHDNGDGTYSITTTTTTGAGDITVEMQGLRFKLHPTGTSVTIGGILYGTYAIVVNAV